MRQFYTTILCYNFENCRINLYDISVGSDTYEARPRAVVVVVSGFLLLVAILKDDILAVLTEVKLLVDSGATEVKVNPTTTALHGDAGQLAPCSRTWPIWPEWGNTSDSSTRIYTTKSCQLPDSFPQGMTKEAMTACLQNRRLFLLGNSIACQFAYHVPLLLGQTGDVPDRESQKEHCPKAFGRGGCSIDAPYNVPVRSFWFLYWNGKPKLPINPQGSSHKKWEPDICNALTVDDCLVNVVFQNQPTRPSDILVTNVGIIYTLSRPARLSNEVSEEEWWKAELRAYIAAIRRHFNGTVLWMSQSKITPASDDYWAQTLDEVAMPLILEETNWTVYDGYHITEPLYGDRKYFADNVHHPGRLTQLGWEFLLGYYCPTAAPALVSDFTV